MKTILIIIGIIAFTFQEVNAQTLSGLEVKAFGSSDTTMIERTKMDLMAIFTYPNPQNIESVTMQIGNAAGQSQLSQVVVPVQQENGNYYTVHKNGVYKITNNKLWVKTTNLDYVDIKGKYITVYLKLKNGGSTEAVSIQY